MSAHSMQEESPGPLGSKPAKTKLISGVAWSNTEKAWPQAGHISDIWRNALDSNQLFAQGWQMQGES